jgi:hypothetical protein
MTRPAIRLLPVSSATADRRRLVAAGSVIRVSTDLRAKEEALRRVATLVAGDSSAESFASVSEETALLLGADAAAVCRL